MAYCDIISGIRQWGWVNDSMNPYDGSYYIPLYGDLLLGYVLLLKGESRPTVNLSRNTVTDLPIDTLCKLSLLNQKLPSCSIPLPFPIEHLTILSERTWRETLNRHPNWVNMLNFDNKTIQELDGIVQKNGNYTSNSLFPFGANPVRCYLLLTALNQRFTLELSHSGALILCKRLNPPEPSELPILLHINRNNENNVLVDYHISFRHSFIYGIQFYSKAHRFSQWLCQNQYALHNLVPTIYDDLLETMLLHVFIKEKRGIHRRCGSSPLHRNPTW